MKTPQVPALAAMTPLGISPNDIAEIKRRWKKGPKGYGQHGLKKGWVECPKCHGTAGIDCEPCENTGAVQPYRVSGDRLSAENCQAINRYVCSFHVAYSWRYIWREYLTKKCKGLEGFKRAVAPEMRKTVVMVFRLCWKANVREYIRTMGHLPIPTQKQVAEIMLGVCSKEDISL